MRMEQCGWQSERKREKMQRITFHAENDWVISVNENIAS